jgi:prevent-host-death family protein
MAKQSDRKAMVREAAASYGTLEVPASDLKNDWHHWLDQVARGRRTLIVTRYGKPIATLAPVSDAEHTPSGFVGAMRGWIVDQGDLIAPIEETWEEDR